MDNTNKPQSPARRWGSRGASFTRRYLRLFTQLFMLNKKSAGVKEYDPDAQLERFREVLRATRRDQ
jgi:hypothetical protein